ncbi:unnamed protein product, partial [Brassica oleracea]
VLLPPYRRQPHSSPRLLSPSTAFSFGGTRLRCLRRLIADSRQSSYQGTHGRRHHRSSQGMVRTQWCGWTQTRTPTPTPTRRRTMKTRLEMKGEEALSDPYFSGLSNSEREPSTQPISKLEFDFERKKLTNDDILEYHPQMLEEYKHGGDQLSFMYPRLASIFIEHILFKQ